jgi:catechol 2,3-dioxygenase-like lactoylglutathione lyase family enzyme
MSRLQLALNVTDIDEAVAYYSKLFGVEPAKRQPGYANYAIAEPPLKLVLFESGEPGGTLNHLGVEVESTDEVTATQRRLTDEGVDTTGEDKVDCCYALQDKVWATGPDGERWEIYTVLADTQATTSTPPSACCS